MNESQVVVEFLPMRMRVYETDLDKLFNARVRHNGRLVVKPRVVNKAVQDWRLRRRKDNPQSKINRDWLAFHFQSAFLDDPYEN